MARNRKRAKERRARRPQTVASRSRDRSSGAPSPLEHAAPDTELARQAELPPDLTEPELEELEEEEVPDDDEAAEEDGFSDLRGTSVEIEDDDVPDARAGEAGVGEVAISPGAVSRPRAASGNRLINFLQGSWRELQRVQWPDRQQVIQATGVVIGFVIVAGVFLGVSDWAAGHLINLIENGHF